MGSLGAMLYSSQLHSGAVRAEDVVRPTLQKPVVEKPVISGKPTRITVPTSDIDLPIDDGTYSPKTGAWTLSAMNAQYLVDSAPANDNEGMTFIYGHGTDAVFGKIGSNTPPAGTQATLFTENGREFTYSLREVKNLTPTDTWILKNSHIGEPRLIIQTCTGAFSEWRTMFIFSFKKVV